MPSKMRLDASLVAGLAAFAGVADAFWRLPCQGRSGLARMDPLMDPGEPSYHVHTVHGSNGFTWDADRSTLLEGSCTSCAVRQDKSAYWAPSLYFVDNETGDSELVDEVGGLLAYYLLTGDKVEPFPQGFRMIAGDPFRRNFTLPVPDPPKSEWAGDAISQDALEQKALGFNCLNYAGQAEDSLSRHHLPEKKWLDENCPNGVRFELMFPSCWNGKDSDADDHKSHMAYPSLVNDGVCPEGFEHRTVSMMFETIWNTYAFKSRDGYFALSTGDATGYGYHGDFMEGWEDGVLEEAVKTCTNPSGMVEDCSVFELQSQIEQNLCSFDIPEILKSEEVKNVKGGLPNKLKVTWGPERAFPIEYTDGHDDSSSSSAAPSSTDSGISLSLPGVGDLGNVFAADPKTSSSSTTEVPAPTTTSTSTTTSTPTPTPSTSYIETPVTQEIVWVEEAIVVLVDDNDKPLKTETRPVEVVSTETKTVTRTSSTVVQVLPTDTAPAKRHHDHLAAHKRHSHGHGH
ncbi:hypothetical protein ASPVEDRAFT_143405 [Aspergillus versicolor CBS 583.65]|uniref:DUF1996 domain-containing protein n=1 Tax=Aspergillus versicolor CBS 583.65 TaxID=1036611 RepID=A0A1L9Q2J5_ASPVE|nr:uncharacterized protein ASPVEDRAFT_143405 [Aspergillus versicolor CBS 583.65]OJJ07946.1 hypothetical protein ASPVEDRAFT_143405 [Aspergillus versicolor CBS 583.65]